MADFQPQSGNNAATDQVSATRVTQWVGALISIALIVGALYWGYRLVVRDVSGIPVVRAIEGPLRVQPEDPGGELADNQGLSVNDVVGDGSATSPASELVLAPEPVDLSEDDQPLGQLVPEEITQASVSGEENDASSAVDLAEALIADQTAEAGEVAAGDEAILLAVLEATAEEEDTSGLTRIIIPPLRPIPDAPAEPAETVEQAPSEPVQDQTVDVDPDTVPDGARLVQLGAFDSEAIARSEWDRMVGIFPGYLDGKSRVIQKAESGGRVFYRLRALGFEDIDDARRFCAAFKARNVDCVPVLVR